MFVCAAFYYRTNRDMSNSQLAKEQKLKPSIRVQFATTRAQILVNF